MKIFHRRYHPPGTAPGTISLDKHEDDRAESRGLKIDVVSYNGNDIANCFDIKIDDVASCIKDDGVSWVHVSGKVTPDALNHFGKLFNLHALALEDVLHHGQRPKIDSYDAQLFIIANMPVATDDDIRIEQVSIFCGKGYVLSFHDQYHEDTYALLYKRLQKNTNHIRHAGSDFLLYVLLDLIIDSSFPVLERFGERLEAIESSLSEQDGKSTLQEIHHIKRELILLRRALWPQRELVNNLSRDDTSFISPPTQPYIRDCYDHTVQILELIESYRDMASSTLDVYLSMVSFRLNETMRFLTIISTVFIPPTFLVGIYGMNFHQDAGPLSMPELSWPFAYLLVWGIIVSMIVSMLVFFKRKGWFRS